MVVLHVCVFGCRENDLEGGKKWYMRFFVVLGSAWECPLDIMEIVTTLTLLENLAMTVLFPYIYQQLSVSY